MTLTCLSSEETAHFGLPYEGPTYVEYTHPSSGST